MFNIYEKGLAVIFEYVGRGGFVKSKVGSDGVRGAD